MRNIKIIEYISLDGVIQAPGDPNETTTRTADGRRMRTRMRERPMVAAHGEAFDLLLDRRTYDIFVDVFRRRVKLSASRRCTLIRGDDRPGTKSLVFIRGATG